MPKGETFWNPYRWVPAAQGPLPRERPLYHHRCEGLAGRLHCTLTALTPLLINDGEGRFIRSRRLQQPFIPATSLKGNIRSLAELIGNAAVPFPKVSIDPSHDLGQAATGDGAGRQLDVAARTFGYLDGKKVFAGLIRFGDGILQGREPTPLNCDVAVGTPKPSHTAFYPGNRNRKLYHHNPGATTLTPPHPGVRRNPVRPLPPGVTFAFRVDFENLREEELQLLLYCLALEESVTVTLSAQAAGGTAPVTLTGPLRHKLGNCKPHGGGSVHIKVERLELRLDPRERYRSVEMTASVFEGDAAVRAEIDRRTQAIRGRNDATMQCLRAMLIYAPGDPRAGNMNYPEFAWLNANSTTQLKPTL